MIPEQRKQTHLAYGLATGLVVVIFNYFAYHFLFDKQSWLTMLPYLPFLIGIILNAIAYSKANNGAITFGNAFGSGFKASLLIALVSVIWILVCIKIFPAMKDRYMEISRQRAASNPQATDEAINASVQWMEKLYAPMMLFFTAIYNILAGFIFSLIGAAIAKKQPAAAE